MRSSKGRLLACPGWRTYGAAIEPNAEANKEASTDKYTDTDTNHGRQ